MRMMRRRVGGRGRGTSRYLSSAGSWVSWVKMVLRWLRICWHGQEYRATYDTLFRTCTLYTGGSQPEAADLFVDLSYYSNLRIGALRSDLSNAES